MSALSAVSDGYVVAKRNLIKIKRVPDLLVFTTLQPIMFVVLFAYVFGGAIKVQGSDLQGVPDRRDLHPDRDLRRHDHRRRPRRRHQEGHHRPLPVAAHVAVGGALRPDPERRRQQPHRRGGHGRHRATSWAGASTPASLEALGGFLLLLVFAYAFSWVMAWVGLLAPSPEVVNNAAFVVIFPLTFVANTFVPTGDAARAVADLRRVEPGVRRRPGRPRGVRQHPARRHRVPDVWSLQHPALYTLDLGGDLPDRVRPAVRTSVQAGGQPLADVRLRVEDLHGEVVAVGRGVLHRLTDAVTVDRRAERALLAVDVEVLVGGDLAAAEQEAHLVAADGRR